MAKTVTDIPALIRELGGLAEASRAFSAPMNTVANWSARESIPTRLYLHHKEVLDAKAIEAPPSLWGFAAPVSERAVR